MRGFPAAAAMVAAAAITWAGMRLAAWQRAAPLGGLPDAPSPSACRLWATANPELQVAHVSWGRPAVDAAAVYGLTRDHELLAFARASRSLLWRRPLAPGRGVTEGTAVLVADGLVVAGDGGVFAVAAATGELRWHLAGDRPDAPAGLAAGRFLADGQESPVGGIFWSGSASGVITAVGVADGRVRWQTPLGSPATTVFAPVAAGGLLVAAFTDFGVSPRAGGVAAFDSAIGSLRWITRFTPRAPPLPASAGGPPLVAGDLVIAASSDGEVYGLARRDGAIRWRLPAVPGPAAAAGSGEAANAVGHAAATDEVPAHEDFRAVAVVWPFLVVTSLTGLLTAYDVRSNPPVERWRFVSPRDGSIAFAITAAAGQLFVPFASGRLFVLAAGDGRLRQVVGSAARRFEWPPAIVGGGLLLASEEGLYECEVVSP